MLGRGPLGGPLSEIYKWQDLGSWEVGIRVYGFVLSLWTCSTSGFLSCSGLFCVNGSGTVTVHQCKILSKFGPGWFLCCWFFVVFWISGFVPVVPDPQVSSCGFGCLKPSWSPLYLAEISNVDCGLGKILFLCVFV
jgi:hypothetical protein